MKALVKKEAKKGIWMEDVPVPEVGVNDVLIRIRKTAICGTDLHIYKWDEWSQKTIKTPMTIGHEYVGIVEKVILPAVIAVTAAVVFSISARIASV